MYATCLSTSRVEAIVTVAHFGSNGSVTRGSEDKERHVMR
jgi:hypothetical protein